MCNDNGDPFIKNVTQRTFGTKFMGQVIFNPYVNEFGVYLFITQKFLYYILSEQNIKKAVTLPHSAQRKYAFWGK